MKKLKRTIEDEQGQPAKEDKTAKKQIDQKQKDATAGEIQYAHTIGRHGTDDEKNLNPEE